MILVLHGGLLQNLSQERAPLYHMKRVTEVLSPQCASIVSHESFDSGHKDIFSVELSDKSSENAFQIPSSRRRTRRSPRMANSNTRTCTGLLG